MNKNELFNGFSEHINKNELFMVFWDQFQDQDLCFLLLIVHNHKWQRLHCLSASSCHIRGSFFINLLTLSFRTSPPSDCDSSVFLTISVPDGTTLSSSFFVSAI
eukprot:TRINITY_DN24621_c0_g1_i1.p1 TRINITY_DN24621_c0_g1~~TRINITY_DN24621_c0_g1_i1.p1  ORF type:complete len:104 (+),score=2.90 TRINITY_DN24621_c0_g1_i1:271-582(+)